MNMELYLKQLCDENEKPLDRFPEDGGFCGIFRSWGCVGDSLASGEFEGTAPDGTKTYHDLYDYSWGQYFARMTGTTARNFSRGGMTAIEYCRSFAESNGFWNPELACTAYIIALGINDLYNQNMEIGSAADVCLEDYNKNNPTFAGNYAMIIQRYKEIQPDARFFLMTFPRDERDDERRIGIRTAHSKLLYDFAELFDNTYVLDLVTYGPEYTEAFKEKFYLGGHMNPCGYMFTAKLLVSYIDYIIRHNMTDFKQVGFIGTPFKNTAD